jgi:release factor glutamine methyltransferase
VTALVNTTDTVAAVDFGVLEIAFDASVLRPRPWTTMQAEWAAELAREVPGGPILELCSGAGHIGLLAVVLSGRRVVQLDRDPSACQFAQLNAERAGVADQVDIRCGDITSTVRSSERFPLIIADPPYIPSGEVTRFPDDPLGAIDGGRDGLDLIRECLAVASGHLADGGACLLQVRGPSQVEALRSLAGPRSFVVHDARVADEERAVALLRREEP